MELASQKVNVKKRMELPLGLVHQGSRFLFTYIHTSFIPLYNFFLNSFGVCCVFVQSSCDSIVKENITYVSKTVNDIQTCKFNIQKVTPDAGRKN